MEYRRNPYETEGFPYIYRIYIKSTNKCVVRTEVSEEMSTQQLRKIIRKYERKHTDMGFNDHLDDKVYENIRVCPFCKRTFRYWIEKQQIGYRMKDYLICPYCKETIASSMSVEYHVQTSEDNKENI